MFDDWYPTENDLELALYPWVDDPTGMEEAEWEMLKWDREEDVEDNTVDEDPECSQ